MKQRVFILSLVSLIIVIFIISSSYVSFRNKTNLLKKINISAINNGDLILRCGRSTESYAVYLADSKAEFTHIGIISLENGTPYVIHAVPHNKNYIKKELLTDFLNSKNTSQFAFFRSNYDSLDLNNVVKNANSFYLKKIEFDSEYNLKTDSKLYCTELILKAFRNAGISLKLKAKEFDYGIGKYKIIFPSEFTKLPTFNRIF